LEAATFLLSRTLRNVQQRPHLDSGVLEPVLEGWWQSFTGGFLYYPGRRLVPAPLRAFIDFIKVVGLIVFKRIHLRHKRRS
jgi:DNA-binding transcriptional LysR family regulator